MHAKRRQVSRGGRPATALAAALTTATFTGLSLVGMPAQATVTTHLFGNSPGDYTYTVPSGFHSLTVLLVGGGGGIPGYTVRLGGSAALIQGTFAVRPGQTLDVEIGGQGGADGASGFGGGGDGGSGALNPSGGGGGATRISLDGVPLIVAGGGGGATRGHDGGSAGLAAPGDSWSVDGTAGQPGTQSAGGAAGAGGQTGAGCIDEGGHPGIDGSPGLDGGLAAGGAGGPATSGDDQSLYGAGAGGGGGYYGGGGGGGSSYCPESAAAVSGGGGGGGSSYVDPRVTVEASDILQHFGNGTAELVNDDTAPPTAHPTVTPPPNAAGWNHTPVHYEWNWTDDFSGVDNLNCLNHGADVTEGSPYHFTATCSDRVGNTATASLTVRVDTTPPRIEVVRPRNGATYPRGAQRLAAYECNDDLSRIATCVGTKANGRAIDTHQLGTHTFTVRAHDRAGNRLVKVVTYTVVKRQHR